MFVLKLNKVVADRTCSRPANTEVSQLAYEMAHANLSFAETVPPYEPVKGHAGSGPRYIIDERPGQGSAIKDTTRLPKGRRL